MKAEVMVDIRTSSGTMLKKLVTSYVRIDERGEKVFDIEATGDDILQLGSPNSYGRNVQTINNPRNRHISFYADTMPPSGLIDALAVMAEAENLEDGCENAYIRCETYIVAPVYCPANGYLLQSVRFRDKMIEVDDFGPKGADATLSMSWNNGTDNVLLHKIAAKYGGAGLDSFFTDEVLNEAKNCLKGYFNKHGASASVEITLEIGGESQAEWAQVNSVEKSMEIIDFVADTVEMRAVKSMLCDCPEFQM